MATRMLQRRGTAAQWANANPILGSGEIGFETDTGQFKMGDGTSNWDDLSYFKNLEDLGGSLDDYILLTQKGAANGVATLDGSNLIPDAQIPNTIARSAAITFEIGNAIADLVGLAPAALDTLEELANSINQDESFFLTITNSISNAQDAAFEYVDNNVATISNNISDIQDSLQEEIANAITSMEDYTDCAIANVTIYIDSADLSLGNAANDYADNLVGNAVSDLQGEIANALSNAESYADDAVDTHNLLTTNIHGIANTAVLVTLTDLANHESDTSNVHGITNTLALVLTSDSRLSDERVPGNGTVTEAKIANNAVTVGKIANNAVTNEKLADNAVDTAEIANNAVTNAKLAGSIDQSKITNLVTDLGNKQDKVSGVSDTEIGYLDGVTSGIQSQLDAKLSLSGGTLTGPLTLAGAPTQSLHPATKAYVDNITAGINFHEEVHAATTGNLSADYNNGTNGVGATLTNNGAQAAIQIDGHSLALNERVLVKNQTDAKQNGLYKVTTVGNGSTNWVLTRAEDADNSPAGEVAYGDFVFVENGSTNAGYGFIVSTAGAITIGTTEINYITFNAAQAINAGNGLSEPTPGTLSINTSITADLSTAQTLTNKTINGSNNTITNVSLTTGVTGTLPVANGGTGITSIANGLATFWQNPTSANLANVVTDETGTGALVFANSPTFVTPTIGAATATSVTFSDGTQSKQGVPSITPILQKTSSYTLSALTERDNLIEMGSASATTLTIPTNTAVAFPIGTSLDILQTGAGQVTIAGDTGVTVNATPGLKLRTQWSSATLFKRDTNTWVAYGDLTA